MSQAVEIALAFLVGLGLPVFATVWTLGALRAARAGGAQRCADRAEREALSRYRRLAAR